MLGLVIMLLCGVLSVALLLTYLGVEMGRTCQMALMHVEMEQDEIKRKELFIMDLHDLYDELEDIYYESDDFAAHKRLEQVISDLKQAMSGGEYEEI